MKILGISKAVGKKTSRNSAVDLWRIDRPLRQLAKHTDWQIDFQPDIIRDLKGFEKIPDEFIRSHGVEEARHLGQYDIIFTSYFMSPHKYTLLWAANKQYGTKIVMDFDDDIIHPDATNFAFWMGVGKEGHEFVNQMARLTENLVVTNEYLAKKLEKHSGVGAKPHIIPNYISDDYEDAEVDNGDKVVIGYFGGASHYADLHNSHALEAIQQIMHENKHVHYHVCGLPVDFYLPRGRTKEFEIVDATEWPGKGISRLKYDISIAPLLDTEFSKSKSDIKWQESTRKGMAVIASNVGPYTDLKDAILVENTKEDWYKAIKKLLDKKTRQKQVKQAKANLKRLEDNWQQYKRLFEDIKG